LGTSYPQLVKLKISAERFLKVLREFGIEYVMIGGIPTGYYGYPRFTEDLDFAADPTATAQTFPQLIQELENRHFLLASTRPTVQELKKIPSLRFVDLQNRTVIDLVLHPEGLKWDSEVLRRRRQEKILSRRMKIWCVSIEDLIIMKLASGESQDYKDLEGIISRRFKEIDWTYLRRRSQEFNLAEEADEIRNRFSTT